MRVNNMTATCLRQAYRQAVTPEQEGREIIVRLSPRVTLHIRYIGQDLRECIAKIVKQTKTGTKQASYVIYNESKLIYLVETLDLKSLQQYYSTETRIIKPCKTGYIDTHIDSRGKTDRRCSLCKVSVPRFWLQPIRGVDGLFCVDCHKTLTDPD